MTRQEKLKAALLPIKYIKLDLKGKVFGNLTVIKAAGRIILNNNYKLSRVVWECLCSCGNTHLVQTAALNRNKINHCEECVNTYKKTSLVKNYFSKMSKEEHTHYTFLNLYRRYKDNAKTYNRTFELTEEEFKQLTSSNCFYCDIKPHKKAQFYYHKKTKVEHYIYNGIDRKDNNKGYTLENSLPCCFSCNEMKKASTFENFVDKIKTIYNNLGNK